MISSVSRLKAVLLVCNWLALAYFFMLVGHDVFSECDGAESSDAATADDVAPATETQWVQFIARDALASGKMQSEAVLFNRKRVDLLTRSHAIEADWGHKWCEGVGQSLYYAAVTGKRPGLLLLLKADGDYRYVEQALVVARSVEPRIDVLAYDVRRQEFVLVNGSGLGHFMED